jgi:hypothetical protein
VLPLDHLEQPAADGAAAHHADAQLAQRLHADAFEPAPGHRLQFAAERSRAAQHVGEAFLVREKRIVPEDRIQLPQ